VVSDKMKIFQLLDAPPSGILIENIHFILFGKQIILDCLYGGVEIPRNFKIQFEDCSKIDWFIHGELDERDTCLDVLDIWLPNDQLEEPIIVATTEVEITIWCKSISIQKEW
jgi:hypothetical protein